MWSTVALNLDRLLEEGVIEHLVTQSFVDRRGTPAVGPLIQLGANELFLRHWLCAARNL